jgi:hypothetical protein
MGKSTGHRIPEQIHLQAGVRDVMGTKKTPTLLVSRYEKAALQLAGTAPERKAYTKLLEREPTTVNAEGLIKAAEVGVVSFHTARKNLTKLTMEQFSAALRLALALSRDAGKLAEFYDHAFWDHKRPNQAKLVLSCLQFAMPPHNDSERKLLSKYASSVNWLVLQGYGPDNLAQGVREEGGLTECAAKLAAWRRERRKARADRADPTIRGETGTAKQPVEGAYSSAKSVTSAAVRLPVQFVKGLRKTVKDRQPPADRKYFWARVRHHGERITIIRIAPGKSRRPPKTRGKAQKSRK